MNNIISTLVFLSSLLTSIFFINGCSTQSPLPEKENLKVSREQPSSKDKCKLLSKVEGRVNTVNGTSEQALEDLKQEAANKGANYLVVQQYSGSGKSVTGEAYLCE